MSANAVREERYLKESQPKTKVYKELFLLFINMPCCLLWIIITMVRKLVQAVRSESCRAKEKDANNDYDDSIMIVEQYMAPYTSLAGRFLKGLQIYIDRRSFDFIANLSIYYLFDNRT